MVLIDVYIYTTGTLVKQSLFDSLKQETIDEPKAKIWTICASMKTTKKKAMIGW